MSRLTASAFVVTFAGLWLVLVTSELGAQGQWGSRKQSVRGPADKLDVAETTTEVIINLEGDVLFDFDKFDIRKEAEPFLQKAIEIVQRYPNGRITTTGHTDSKGSRPYNLRLSEQRAESVRAWLVKNGVTAERITTRGYGESQPVAPNANPDGSDNPAGRQKNRRVEIIVRKD